MNPLPAAAARVEAAAEALGLAIAVRLMPDSTRTAAEAAAACDCAVGQIVKSLIFKGKDTGRPLLLLVSGANRVNEKGVAVTIGEQLTRPDADFARVVTGFAIGGIPPLGHATPLRDVDRRGPAAIRDGLGGRRHAQCGLFSRSGAASRRRPGDRDPRDLNAAEGTTSNHEVLVAG